MLLGPDHSWEWSRGRESILKVEETEVQRVELVCLGSHKWVERGPRQESSSPTRP